MTGACQMAPDIYSDMSPVMQVSSCLPQVSTASHSEYHTAGSGPLAASLLALIVYMPMPTFLMH